MAFGSSTLTLRSSSIGATIGLSVPQLLTGDNAYMCNECGTKTEALSRVAYTAPGSTACKSAARVLSRTRAFWTDGLKPLITV